LADEAGFSRPAEVPFPGNGDDVAQFGECHGGGTLAETGSLYRVNILPAAGRLQKLQLINSLRRM
jgi:hypothetical protein